MPLCGSAFHENVGDQGVGCVWWFFAVTHPVLMRYANCG
jgi:hypothetical protein